jgi:hypothetical protein
MNTSTARYLRPAPLGLATLAVALVVLVIAVAVAVALAAGLDTNSIAGADTSPFRWA